MSLLANLKTWAGRLRRDVVALWLAARDPRTPLVAKLMAGLVAAYALSPIDLIPDFVPVLGYLDDLILVPLGIAVAVRLVPVALMREFRSAAAARLDRPGGRIGALMIVALWLGVGLFLSILAFRALAWRI